MGQCFQFSYPDWRSLQLSLVNLGFIILLMKSPAGKIRLLDWRVLINESLNVETSFFQSVLRVYLHDHKTKRMSFSLHLPIHIFKPDWNIPHSASIKNDAVSSRCRSITAYFWQSVFKRKSNLFKSRINTAVQCMSFHINYFIQILLVCSSATLHSSCHHQHRKYKITRWRNSTSSGYIDFSSI